MSSDKKGVGISNELIESKERGNNAVPSTSNSKTEHLLPTVTTREQLKKLMENALLVEEGECEASSSNISDSALKEIHIIEDSCDGDNQSSRSTPSIEDSKSINSTENTDSLSASTSKDKHVKKVAKRPKSNKNQQLRLKNFLRNDSKFLQDFDPERSSREQRKLYRRNVPAVQSTPNTLHDEKGRYRDSGLDVCDCFDQKCPGCHFPCPQCKSQKCGPNCRVDRKWTFEFYECDGKDYKFYNRVIADNSFLTKKTRGSKAVNL